MQQSKTPSFKETEEIVDINDERIDTSLLIPTSHPKGKVLLLHGAGESTKDRLVPLARALSSIGWSCLTFSLPGHGNSSGTLTNSTLRGRKEMSHKVAEHFGFWRPDIVIGVSMGCHTALSLLDDEPDAYAKLVLLVPAIYAAEAEDVPFGPSFSDVLRTPRSYASSEDWGTLQTYRGKLSVIQTEKDQVIPTEIYELIAANSDDHNRQDVLIGGCTHQVSVWMAEQQERCDDFAKAIDAFDFSDLKKYQP